MFLENHVLRPSCNDDPPICNNDEYKSCISEYDADDRKIAYCRCKQGYEDDSKFKRKDNKILAENTTLLTCVDHDECGDYSQHDCKNNQDCVNTEGTYHCRCKEGWLDTWNRIPCVKCSGIGAKEDDGKCTCTAVKNAVLAKASIILCVCADNYEKSTDGLSCVAINNTGR